jgi:hypothetical protein
MNYRTSSLIILTVIYLTISFTTSVHAYFAQDTTKADSADYTHADVVVTTEWSGTEKNSDVSVYIEYKDKKPSTLLMIKEHKRCEIILMPGVTAKIYDNKTGKLLKTFKQ